MLEDYVCYWIKNGQIRMLRVLSKAEAVRAAKEKHGGYIEAARYNELTEEKIRAECNNT